MLVEVEEEYACVMGALPLHCSEHLQVALLAILELRVRSEQHTKTSHSLLVVYGLPKT